MAVTYDTPAQVQAGAAAEATRYAGVPGGSNDMLVGRMPDAVKGAGFIQPGGNKPLDGAKDADEIFERSFNAVTSLRKATSDGINNPSGVYKALNPSFVNQFPAFMAQGSPGFGGAAACLQ